MSHTAAFDFDAFIASYPDFMQQRAESTVFLLLSLDAADATVSREIRNAHAKNMGSWLEAQRWRGGPLGRRNGVAIEDLVGAYETIQLAA